VSLRLKKRVTRKAEIFEIEGGMRLYLKNGDARSYRLAQLDDYGHLSRSAFPHKPTVLLSLKARSSKNDLPGTWGFGLWNDPFGFSLGFSASARRLPTLPNAAWFFFASSENYLAFHDGPPGFGATASVYRSPHIPAPLMAISLPLLPLLAWPPGARWLRRRSAQFVQQEGISIEHEPTSWHQYDIRWETDLVTFSIDEQIILETSISPRPPLGLVVWIDNQYAAWPPDGRVRYGILATPKECWLEIKDLYLD
jgi:hypothetical protein